MNKSYKGKILISTPDHSGDIFSRSVVLIVEHTRQGAFGLILNKLNFDLSSKIKEKLGYSVDIYEGGPVEKDKIFVIGKGNPPTDFFLTLDDNFYITEDMETVITNVIENKIEPDDVRFFSGYSGWESNQLENEVKRKFWTIVEVFNIDYTSPDNYDLWRKIMQNLGGEYLLWANAPNNISMN